jgi:hypothetical protein
LSPGCHHHQTLWIEEVLNFGCAHVGLDHFGSQGQEIMYTCLDAAIISSLRNRNSAERKATT